MLPETELNNNETGFSEVLRKASENVQTEIQENEVKKKRGRKPKTEKASLVPEDVNQPVKLDQAQVSMVAQQGLQVLGVILAKGLKCPDLEFTQEESKMLGDSMANASQYFMPEIHPKWIALGGLCVCTGMITFAKMSAYNAHIERNTPKNDDGVLKN